LLDFGNDWKTAYMRLNSYLPIGSRVYGVWTRDLYFRARIARIEERDYFYVVYDDGDTRHALPQQVVLHSNGVVSKLGIRKGAKVWVLLHGISIDNIREDDYAAVGIVTETSQTMASLLSGEFQVSVNGRLKNVPLRCLRPFDEQRLVTSVLPKYDGSKVLCEWNHNLYYLGTIKERKHRTLMYHLEFDGGRGCGWFDRAQFFAETDCVPLVQFSQDRKSNCLTGKQVLVKYESNPRDDTYEIGKVAGNWIEFDKHQRLLAFFDRNTTLVVNQSSPH